MGSWPLEPDVPDSKDTPPRRDPAHANRVNELESPFFIGIGIISLRDHLTKAADLRKGWLDAD